MIVLAPTVIFLVAFAVALELPGVLKRAPVGSHGRRLTAGR
jgi:hypothetical protein